MGKGMLLKIPALFAKDQVNKLKKSVLFVLARRSPPSWRRSVLKFQKVCLMVMLLKFLISEINPLQEHLQIWRPLLLKFQLRNGRDKV